MDFMAQFDTVANSEAGAKLHFKLPNGKYAFIDGDKEKPVKAVTVSMSGGSSDAHKKHTIKQVRKLRAAALKKEKLTHGKGEDEELMSDTFFEETAESQVERLVAVVTSWENMVDDKGVDLKCNAKNVRFIFTKYQSLRVQAINFLEDDVNFIQGSLIA